MVKFAFLAAAALAVAVPAAAQTSVQPAAAPAPIVVSNTKSEVNRIVCKKEIPIGSRLGAKKVCLTVKEWQDRADADRDSTERVQQQAPTRSSG